VPKLTRKRTILLKTESSYGTDPSPTGSANAVLVRDLNIEPIQSDEVSRDLIRGYLGNYDVLLANQHVNLSFDVEMSASGTAGTEPHYSPALKAAGLAVTTVSATSNTYAPVSSSFSSCTVYVNIDGVNHAVTGCRGTFSISCSVNEIPVISFNLTGKYNAPADVTLPTCTYQKQADPVIFKNDNVSGFEIFGSSMALQSWSFDLNNDTVYRELIGTTATKEVLITDRKPSGTLEIEAPALSSKNFFTIATGTATGSNKFTYDAGGAGKKVEVSCPYTDISAPSYGDSEGIVTLSLPFVATPSSGNDELSIKYF
jgi:hypothetical protein